MTRSPRTVDLNFATRGVTPDAENRELVAAFSFAPSEAGTVLLQSKGYAGCHKSRLAFDERLRNLTLINGGCSGDAACGGQLFTEKGCAVCHNDPSSGAPTLARGAGGYSDITMVTVVWRHGPAMLDGMMQRNLAWARFTAQQMADPDRPPEHASGPAINVASITMTNWAHTNVSCLKCHLPA